jgi:hypothetical protein
MSIESFQPTQTATAESSARLLGDTWAPRAQETKAPTQTESPPAPNQEKQPQETAPAQRQEQTPGPRPEQRAPEQQERSPGAQERHERPPITEQTLKDMIKDAGEGKLNDTAREVLLRGLQGGGIKGLVAGAEAINKLLTESGSDYRVSFLASINKDTKEINIGIALTKPNENTPAIIQDIVKNGANSPYAGRGMHIQMTPSKPGQNI